MNRIDKKFKELKKNKKKAFIAFITAGYPSLSVTEKLVFEFEKIGVDLVELGVPFSDPLADGPIIQEASEYSLKKGTRLVDLLNLVKKIRRSSSLPICLMTYYNPVFCFGQEKFVSQAAACGVDGAIIPDLPPEEAKALIKEANANDFRIIFFVAPTTSEARIKLISKAAKGFIYYVSLTGVTGPRKKLALNLAGQVKLIKRHTQKPICVGFGVSNPGQIKQLRRISDGVIVGSAIVNKIKENISRPDLIKKVSSFVSNLKNV